MSGAPVFWIKGSDDENLELGVDRKIVAQLNHEEHGRAGMQQAEDMFRRIAFAIGAKVQER
jgi:hypothetical protein